METRHNEHDRNKLAELCDLFGDHLAHLINDVGVPLRKAEFITQKACKKSLRACYRQDFKNRQDLKGRQLESKAQAEQITRLSQSLGKLPFAHFLAQHENTVLEEWVAGTPLNRLSLRAQDYKLAGQLLGQLATCLPARSDTNPVRDTQHELEWRLGKLNTHVSELQAAGLINSRTARYLPELALSNVPDQLEKGLCHLDYCPANILRSRDTLAVIDLELLANTALDGDLARTFYLWPMHDKARNQFLNGYGLQRSPQSFIHHELFWAVTTLAAAAHYQHSIEQLDPRLIESLEILATDRLPNPWLHTAATR